MSNSLPTEPSSESLSTKVVTEVAAAKGVSPIDMRPPLYETIDPEALDALFEKPSQDGQVSFKYSGCEVTVGSNGKVDVSSTEKVLSDD